MNRRASGTPRSRTGSAVPKVPNWLKVLTPGLPKFSKFRLLPIGTDRTRRPLGRCSAVQRTSHQATARRTIRRGRRSCSPCSPTPSRQAEWSRSCTDTQCSTVSNMASCRTHRRSAAADCRCRAQPRSRSSRTRRRPAQPEARRASPRRPDPAVRAIAAGCVRAIPGVCAQTRSIVLRSRGRHARGHKQPTCQHQQSDESPHPPSPPTGSPQSPPSHLVRPTARPRRRARADYTTRGR